MPVRSLALARTTLAIVALAAATGRLPAQSFSYSNFSSVAGLTLNGSTVQNGAKLRLTPADFNQGGSAFSTTAITLGATASFSTLFTFEILNRGGLEGGADGLTFTLQTTGNNVGGIGGGLGYSGVSNSVAVEFDTFDNGETGGSNHVGIDTNGNTNSIATTGLLTPDFDDGNVWYAWVDYNGATQLLEARWSQTGVRPAGALLSATVDLPTILGSTNVFAGFTAGTGSGFGEHDILSWTFANQFVPGGIVSTPEPATVALMATGLAGIAGTVLRRRRQAA